MEVTRSEPNAKQSRTARLSQTRAEGSKWLLRGRPAASPWAGELYPPDSLKGACVPWLSEQTSALGFQVGAGVSFVMRSGQNGGNGGLARPSPLSLAPTCPHGLFVPLSWWDCLRTSSDPNTLRDQLNTTMLGKGATLSLGNEEPGETGKTCF